MSQRTRSHTTGAAKHSPRATSKANARDSSKPVARAQPDTAPADPRPLDPAHIARTLRAVADELERDPALARRVASSAGHAMPGVATTDATAAIPARDAIPPEAGASEDDARRGTDRRFHPRLVTGAPPDLGPGIPDPFALRAARGEAGLRVALEMLRLGTLRAIVRAHHLDPSGRIIRQNDAERLRALILDASEPAQT